MRRAILALALLLCTLPVRGAMWRPVDWSYAEWRASDRAVIGVIIKFKIFLPDFLHIINGIRC